MLSRILRTLEPSLVRLYRRFSDPPIPNLRGDREIEYSWIAAQMPNGPGQALEFGCGQSYLGLMAAHRGFKTTGIDLTHVHWFYAHPNLNFRQEDLFETGFAQSSFDLIINCSAIEHVGLGRYGGRPDADGDLRAMQLMRTLLRPTGLMLLTLPVGKDAVYAPLHRVYGRVRLPRLLNSFVIGEKAYWIKDQSNRWVSANEDVALAKQTDPHVYGLGCFVLGVNQALDDAQRPC